VYVPGGEFTMGLSDAEVDEALALCEEYLEGCERSWLDHEQPQHQVHVDGFWIGQTEVTNAGYKRFIEADGYTTPAYWTEEGWQWKEEEGVSEPEYWRDSTWSGAQQPVVGVSWYEADAFARWAGGRLPTEAEWEYAARGDDGRTFPWGDVWDGSKCNYCDSNCDPVAWRDESVDDGYHWTAPVGSYGSGASPFGALDMAGNVWEWCADWYDEEYYSQSPARNPAGPASGTSRVLRGGSWLNHRWYVRCACRRWHNPHVRINLIGFRVVVAAP
jgi:formylglycine-generating enzyme required for sulfatase activity